MATDDPSGSGTASSPLELLWHYLLSAPGDLVFFVQAADGAYKLAGRAFTLDSTLSTVQGLRDSQIFDGATATELQRLHEWIVTNRRPVIEVLMNMAAGSQRWCLLTKFPILRGPGQPISEMVGYFRYLRIPVEMQAQLENIARALEFFRTNMSQPHTLEQLAEIAGMNAVKFDRRVQRILGCSTREYMIRVRMEFAKALFRDMDREISSIARECGYGNASSFARQFKNWSGITPTEYRADLASQP